MAKTIEFKLPDIGEGVAEGEITSWKVKAGDVLAEDQIMVEVMTDKATVEIGSPVAGRVVELKADEGQTVPVGSVIVVLESGGEAAAPAKQPAKTAPAAKSAPAPAAKSAPSPAAKSAPAKTPSPAKPAKGGGEEINFALPDIGEGVAEGEVTRWMVKAGERVAEDQPIVEVMTDKATVEIGSPVDGEVVELLVEAGQTVPVGEILLVLRAGNASGARATRAAASDEDRDEDVGAVDDDEESEDAELPRAQPAAKTAAKSSGNAVKSAARPAAAAAAAGVAVRAAPTGLPDRGDGTRRVRAAPAVRRFAREAGVDLSLLDGSGPSGRVLLDDVRAAAARADNGAESDTDNGAESVESAPRRPAAAAAPRRAAAAVSSGVTAVPPHDLEGDERVPLRGLRKRIAKQMRVAKHSAAHFTYVEELDVTELVRLRNTAKERVAQSGVKLTYMPFILKALVPALRAFPLLNASLDEETEELVLHRAINVGIAVDTPAGLIVPVLRDVDKKSLLELASEMAELAERARAGKARPDDLGGGTFTITNAGNIGGYFATPIINVPEVAILGVHAIRRRPWVVDERIEVRDIMLLSLSLDHRVVDGAVGAHAMNRIRERLEQPALLLFDDQPGA